MAERRVTPYVWTTWLTKLMAGENSCEWSTWFKACNESWSYSKVPDSFDVATWQLNHTSLLNRFQLQLEREGRVIFTENQNKFSLRGKNAVLGCKPDLVTVNGNDGIIYDVKTGRPSPSHHIQVMTYMYALPRALKQYSGIVFQGKVVYENQEIDIPSSAVDRTFIANLGELICRVSANDAHGPHSSDLVRTVDRSQVPRADELEVGARISATLVGGHRAFMRIVDISDDDVTVDLNHPLAGKTLIYEISMIEII